MADQVPTFGRAGDQARAEQVAFEAARIADRVYTSPHTNKAAVHCQLAAHLHWRGRYAEAIEHYATANDIARQLQRSDLHVQACFMFAGYARAALGDYQGALHDLERSGEILEDHDYRSTSTGYANCGTHATVQLRLADLQGAERTLAGCPLGEGDSSPLMHAQARAELHFARGEFNDAARLAAETRKARPPEAEDRYWMRPWMLSLLLAHDMRDATAKASLVAELGEFAQRPPLSHCLATPNEANCLVLP